MKNKLTHTSKNGKANMVDVSDKDISIRTAEAYSELKINDEVLKAIQENNIKKGDVLTVAKLAGIQAAKKTAELIPLCHNIFITKIDFHTISFVFRKYTLLKTFHSKGNCTST